MITQAKQVIQVGLKPVRCASCNALLCTASTGSVISVVCGRCKTHNIIEVINKFDLQKNSDNTL